MCYLVGPYDIECQDLVSILPDIVSRFGIYSSITNLFILLQGFLLICSHISWHSLSLQSWILDFFSCCDLHSYIFCWWVHCRFIPKSIFRIQMGNYYYYFLFDSGLVLYFLSTYSCNLVTGTPLILSGKMCFSVWDSVHWSGVLNGGYP